MECWLNTARLYADAIQSFSKLTAPDPHAPHLHTFLAASLAQLGNSTAAAAHAREVLQREPAFTAEGFLGNLHYQQHSDAEHLRDGLVKACLPN
jgi:adenylate cyclase